VGTVVTYLKQSYLEYNSRYFRGRLPKDCRVIYSDLSKLRYMGAHKATTKDGDRKNSKHIIWIDHKLRWSNKLVDMTLLHEMVHLKLFKKYGHEVPRGLHGPLFQKEMKRLAKVGAFNRLW